MYQIKKHLEAQPPKCFIPSVPARARTVDPLIKSQLLYQLSYRDKPLDLDGKIMEKGTNPRKILVGLSAKRHFSPKLAARRKFKRRFDNNDLGRKAGDCTRR
jgi:hypothetical protein